jgi:hypothetical protein
MEFTPRQRRAALLLAVAGQKRALDSPHLHRHQRTNSLLVKLGASTRLSSDAQPNLRRRQRDSAPADIQFARDRGAHSPYPRSMGGWQGVAMDSLKFHPGPL